jgi:hypothetical protein
VKDIAVGGLYRHSKTGNLYTVLHVGIYCGGWGSLQSWAADVKATGFPEGTELVVYAGHYDNSRGNHIYIRPASEWLELVRLPLPGDSYNGPARIHDVPRFRLHLPQSASDGIGQSLRGGGAK